MAKKKKGTNTITMTGYERIIRDIEKMGGHVEKACEKAVGNSARIVNAQMQDMIAQHKITGLTEESLVKSPKVEHEGSKIILQTGFNIDRGGAPSIWLDRGNPHQYGIGWVKKIKGNRGVKRAIDDILKVVLEDL